MKIIFFTIAAFLFASASAQKVSGFYSGTLYNDTTKLLQQYQLALSEYRGKITGYSYVTFVSNDTFYYGIRRVKGRIDGENLVVEDDKFLAHNFPEAPAKGVKRLFVIPLNNQDSLVNLNGTWETNRTKKYYSIPGKVDMKRSTDSANSALFTHLRELDIISSPNYRNNANISRKNNQNKLPENSKETIPVAIPYDKRARNELAVFDIVGDSIQLSFYDNGMIDGDSVSVYVGNENIIPNSKLTAVAIRKTISVTEDEFEILLVAENLGTIPPNTGLLMIKDGDIIHQLHFSADLQTNAAIRIRKKKIK